MAKARIRRRVQRARILDLMKAPREILRTTSLKNDPKVLPALILVWALLLCHGLLGFVHQLSLDAGASADPAGHPAHHMHEGSAPSGGEDAPFFGSADYFAVVLILFAAAWLWWRSGCGRLVTWRATYRRVVSAPFHIPWLLPRPRAPALQVFRL
jgi:hypothetical protein